MLIFVLASGVVFLHNGNAFLADETKWFTKMKNMAGNNLIIKSIKLKGTNYTQNTIYNRIAI